MFGNKKEINFLDNIKKSYENLAPVKKRKKNKILKKFLKYFFVFMVVVFLFFVSFFLFLFLSFKSVYVEAKNGKVNIEYAMKYAQEKDFDNAKSYAKKAQNNFIFINRNLKELQNNFFIKYIYFFRIQINDLVYLGNTAEILSRSLVDFTDFGKAMNVFLENNGSSKEQKDVLKYIYENAPELTGIHANIELAVLNMDNVRYAGGLFFLKNKIEKFEFYLQELEKILDDAIPMAQLFPFVFGYPEKSSFLVLLQNKDELRPTGGFLGTYGILETRMGNVDRFDTHDIYHMDIPVQDDFQIKAPKPLQEYLGVENWYMRDANWSPDWPVSADKIEWFFYQENSLLKGKNSINNFNSKFDGVIAVNPNLIIDLLDVLGPVNIDGEEYNKDNFMDLLQYRVEKGYVQLGISSWHRKEVIGQIAVELKKRVFQQSTVKLFEVFNIISKSLFEKDILIKFNNQHFQEIVLEKNWAGQVRQSEDDYLMVVDANMAAFKTDAVVARNIEYQVNELVNNENELDLYQGDLIADLKIHYSHNGDFDWRTTRYRTYTRVYVPQGSLLLVDDPDVDVYDELGKTVFAKFISIEPGEVGTLSFRYKLPDDLSDKKSYNLLVQKQPGNDIESLNVDLNFAEDIKEYSPTGFYVDKLFGNIEWEIALNADRYFEIDF